MSKTLKKTPRRKNKIHEDLLNDPRYKQKIEKSYKVKKREQDEQEANKEIADYTRPDVRNKEAS